MSKLDGFLLEKADVYNRLTLAFETAELHFWKQLGKSLRAMVKDLLGETWSDTFGEDEFGKLEWNGYAFCEAWKLEFNEELKNDYESYPSFWFPQDYEQMDMLSLFGITEDSEVPACIWSRPISHFLNDFTWPKTEWEKAVNTPLRKRGWLSYGDRITTPKGDWGTYLPIRLNHLEIAKGMEAGDLRPALEPLENALKDFASVRNGIQDIIEKARKRKNLSAKKK